MDKTLTSLAASGKITCKEFGKIKIYFPKQEEAKELSGEVSMYYMYQLAVDVALGL